MMIGEAGSQAQSALFHASPSVQVKTCPQPPPPHWVVAAAENMSIMKTVLSTNRVTDLTLHPIILATFFATCPRA
jgi:hypothetical protein